MKPRIRRLPRTGDSEAYWVQWNGHGERIVISGCLMAVTRRHPLRLLADEIAYRFRPEEKVSRLTAPSL